MHIISIIGLIYLYIHTGLYCKHIAGRNFDWYVESQVAFVIFWPIVLAFCLLGSYIGFTYLFLTNQLDDDEWY